MLDKQTENKMKLTSLVSMTGSRLVASAAADLSVDDVPNSAVRLLSSYSTLSPTFCCIILKKRQANQWSDEYKIYYMFQHVRQMEDIMRVQTESKNETHVIVIT